MVAPLFLRAGIPRHKFPAVLPSQPNNNVGPQGIGLNVLIVPAVRQRLIWWSDEELVQQVLTIVDDDQWILGPQGQFTPYKPPVVADEDWIASIGVDEDYDWKARDCKPYPILQARTADEDVWTASIGVDEDLPYINRYSQFSYSTAVTSDEDVWTPSIGVDEDLPALPQQSRPFGLAQAVNSDEDVLPLIVQPFGLDEDYWIIRGYSGYVIPPSATIADEDVWTSSIGIDEDYPWIPKLSPQWVPAQPTTSDEDIAVTVVPFGLDEDYWLINRYSGHVVPLQALLDDEVWPSGTVPIPPVGGGGVRKSFRYDRWGRKKKQAYRASPEAVQIIQELAQAYSDVPDLAAAIARLDFELKKEQIRTIAVYGELLKLEIDRLEFEQDEEDDDFMMLQ